MPWPFRRSKAIDQFALKHATLLYGVGAARWLERRFDLLAKEGYEQNPVVYSCVSKLARAVASVDLHLYRQQGGKLVKVDKSPLLDLLVHPNPTMGGRKFLESVVTSKLIGGNAYIHGVGINARSRRSAPPKELWLLPTQHTAPETQTRSFLPLAYLYKPTQTETVRFPVDQITGLSEVLHLKTVNPLNPAIGLPPLVAAAYGVDIFNAGQSWNKAMLDNECRPSGALEFVDGDGKPISLTTEQRDGIKQMIDTRFSGTGNAGKPLILEGGMKWVSLSLSPKDMDHRENMLTNARFIAGVFHTPPQLVNIPGESTYSNYAEAKIAYYSDTVLPFLESMLEDLNNWLPQFYGDDLFIWYDEDMIPALEPRRKEKSDRVNASTFMTINEKRQAMGMDTVESGDIILVPTTSIPLELAGTTTMEPPAPEPTPEQEPEAAAKHRNRLIDAGYTPERAERLTKLAYS